MKLRGGVCIFAFERTMLAGIVMKKRLGPQMRFLPSLSSRFDLGTHTSVYASRFQQRSWILQLNRL